MADFNPATTWIGIGNKSGGILFVVGMEGTTGRIYNLGNPQYLIDFSIVNARFGLGLGGTVAQAVLVVAFNCAHGGDLKRVDVNDWGVNVSLGGRWAQVARNMSRIPTMMRVIRALNSGVGKALGVNNLDEVRNLASYLYTNLEVRSAGNDPKIIAIDIPAIGYLN